MLLTRLILKNFKRFDHQEIIFRDGITGIVGNNGTGKSTIIEGVIFALYGIQNTGIDSDYIISSAAGSGAECEVILDFRILSDSAGRGDDYRIKRTFKKTAKGSTHNVWLNRNGKLLAKDVKPVSSVVNQLIGMGALDFKNTVYAQQKDLLNLLQSQPAARKEWFMKTLGIDYIRDDSLNLLKSEIDSCEKGLQKLTGRLEELDVQGAEERQKNVEAALEKETENLAGASKDLNLLEIRVRQLEEKNASLRKQEQDFRLLEHDAEIKKLDLKQTREECLKIENDIGDLESRRPEFEDLLAKESVFIKLRQEQEEIRECRSMFDRIQATMDQCEVHQRQCNERILEIQHRIKDLDNDAATCRSLESDVSRRKEVIGRLEVLRAGEPLYNRLQEKIHRMEEQFISLSKDVNENNKVVDELKGLSGKLTELDSELARYEQIRKETEAFSNGRLHEERLTGLRASIKDIKSAIGRNEQNIADIHARLSEYDEIEAKISNCRALRDETFRMQQKLCAERDVLCRELKELEEHIAGITELGAESICPMCQRPLEDHYDVLVKDLLHQREEGRREIEELDLRISDESQKSEKQSLELKELAAAENRFKELKNELFKLESKLKAQHENLSWFEKDEEKELAAIRDLGIDEYDPAIHEQLLARLRALDQVKKEADMIRGRVNDLPRFEKERLELMHVVEQHIIEKESLEQECVEIDFDPEEKMRLENDLGSLDDGHQRYIEAMERLKNKPSYIQAIVDEEQKRGEIRQQLDGLISRQSALGYDPARFREISREFEEATIDHEAYLALREKMMQVPGLQERLNEKQITCREKEEEYSKTIQKIEAATFDPAALPEVESDLRSANENLRKCAERRTSIEKQCSTLGEECRRIHELLEKADEYLKKQDAWREEIEMLKLTRRMIGDYTHYLLNVVRKRIQQEIGMVLSEITDGRYDTVIIDEDFDVLVNDMGVDYPSGRFSGGERDDIAISLRIALSRYLSWENLANDASILIFDEIFGSQDEERRSNLLQALRTQESHFPQIIIISHIPEVQGEFTNTLLVEMCSDQTSRVQEITV